MTRDEFIRNTESCQKAFRRFLTALCCGDSDEADDIAQESLVKAYLSCDGLKEPAKFKAWLYRIGFNTFFSHRRAVRPTAALDDTPETEAPERSDNAFRYQALYAALDRIPERERTSILLYYMEGYSVREISGIVEVSEEAVRQHLSRGRSHLRGLVSENS